MVEQEIVNFLVDGSIPSGFAKLYHEAIMKIQIFRDKRNGIEDCIIKVNDLFYSDETNVHMLVDLLKMISESKETISVEVFTLAQNEVL